VIRVHLLRTGIDQLFGERGGAMRKPEIYFTFINQYQQIFGEYNWYDITIIELSFEYDMEMTGGYEFTFILLGIGFLFRHTVDLENSVVGKRLKDIRG